MNLSKFKGKKLLIVGYGIEGKATHRFFKKYLPQNFIGIADQQEGPDYLGRQENFDIAIRSPSVPKELITIAYTTATNIFFSNTKGITIGVTGTKGKSTTSSLIHAILTKARLQSYLVGNIGKPMLQELLSERGSDRIYVCELSSYQLADLNYSPHISVILNLFPEHMDFHGSKQKYWEAKERIIAYAKPDDYYVYNPGYDRLAQLAGRTEAQSVPFDSTLPLPESDIPLLGAHNRVNVCAAATVGRIMGISVATMASAIKTFAPLPHRLELVGTFNGIIFYDDAIATTPEATIEAIKSLQPIGTILLGGLDRGYDFSTLVSTIVSYNIPNIVLFPDSGRRIISLLAKDRNIFPTSSMEDAVKFAYQNTEKGTVCLLSSASPSYSLWKNFEEKGDQFKKFVIQYGKTK